MFRVNSSRYVITVCGKRALLGSPGLRPEVAGQLKLKQTATPNSEERANIKKYSRPPPIDLKSVRTNTSSGSEHNEGSGSSKKSSKLPAIALLSIPVVTFALGVWQVRRREQKLNMIAFLNSRTKSEPISLPLDRKQLDTLVVENEYRPIRVRGHFLHSREIILSMRHDLSGRTHIPGGFVITPLVLSANPEIIVLVNRGFVPYTHFSPMSRTDSQINDEVEVVGLLRADEPLNTFTPVNVPPNEWHYRDVAKMAQTLGTAPVFLDAISTTGLSAKSYPLPGQTVIQLRNDHLIYLFTWFSLSLITSFLWWRRFKNVFF